MQVRIISLLIIFCSIYTKAQFIQTTTEKFTKADTLRGMLRPDRTCFDVKYYSINLELFINNKSISGFVDMHFLALKDFQKIQIDLYQNMIIDSIVTGDLSCKFSREYNAVYVILPEQKSGQMGSIRVYYHGSPKIAKNPPWDGGFVWSKDKSKNPWIGVACEGDGASLWWPCKDHPSDKPDSLSFQMTVPNSLTCISNGNLAGKTSLGDNRNTFHWKVSYPINLYNVSFYVGDYYLIDETYSNFSNKNLDIDYWIIGKQFFKAQLHFKQVQNMLHAYEHYFGPYPFFNDGYALVESPYLGMEHQGAIAYGNNYNRGYLGGRLPADQNFDYIIIHESAHEYWGNSVSADDHADLWVHESFTTYSEALYVEWINNYQKAVEYLLFQKPSIQNLSPLVGIRNVNYQNWKDSDMYIKGSWMLHSLRNTINNDQLWFAYIKALYNNFKGTVTNTTAIVNFSCQYFDRNLNPFFRQFLIYSQLPILEYFIEKKGKGIVLYYRWLCDVPTFDMPQKVGNGKELWRIFPKSKWQKTKFDQISKNNFMIDDASFLMKTVELFEKPKI